MEAAGGMGRRGATAALSGVGCQRGGVPGKDRPQKMRCELVGSICGSENDCEAGESLLAVPLVLAK